MINKRKNIKNSNLLALGLGIILIILVNVISSYIFTRLDLTAEKRYSLSEATRDMLDDLDDLVYFRVYLDGEFPAGFKRLARETREMLDEFRAHNPNIEYEFINPSAPSGEQERQRVFTQLVEKGLSPTDLQVKTREGTSKRIIFPGAIASFHGRETPIQLLISQQTAPPEEILNNSIQNIEFSLADAIRRLTTSYKPKIAFIQGHGELDKNETLDATAALQQYYIVERVTIGGQLNSLTERQESNDEVTAIRNKFAAIIIAKPDSAFTEKDKFIIDQYIMRGGSVLWLVEPVIASMDSLQVSSETMGLGIDLGLNDMFFKYGFRLNWDLVMDLNALSIPVNVGQMGGQPQFEFFPWYFFPILTPLSNNPIVKNLNAIKTDFISSIDFVNSSINIDKTVLLTSSNHSRTVNTPVLISLEILGQNPDERLYNKEYIPVAALVEGTFESLFNNRVPPEIAESKEIGFIGESKKTKMIVIADGDVIKNQMHLSQGNYYPLPLGYDKYTGQQFGNKELILNALNYLTDDSGLISVRARELKLRLLDRNRIENERIYWQVFNTIIPVLIVIIFGIILGVMRRRKYAR
nr:gliding motility-associated ABC transporter substrate-binding protein GldG [Bacteroidota bacterium]